MTEVFVKKFVSHMCMCFSNVGRCDADRFLTCLYASLADRMIADHI